MNKLSSFTTLVTASLLSIAAESVWSDETTPNGSAAPAAAPMPATGPAPGWYPPPPNQGYAQPWQQPPHWAMPPPGYGQLPPRYPVRGQSQAVPAAPAVAVADNPLGAELKQTQEQLTASRTELEQARAMLEELQGKLQHSLEAEQVLSENVATITSEQQSLQARVTELNAELNTTAATLEQKHQQITNDEQQTRTLTTERDRLREELASRDEQLATVNTELQTATEALQRAKSETTASTGELSEARAQAETLNKELSELKARLESRESTLLDTEKRLADVTTERDGLQADLAERGRELTQAQAALTAAQSEMASGEAVEVDTVEVAALQIANPDADEDGVPDSVDLCLETQQGIAVESTGCAAGVAISLEGVNFRYNSHELTDDAQRILDRVAKTLSRHSDLRLQVAGHTDAQGDPAYNQWLSLQRAQTVRDYLVAQGVNPDHIGAAGYGGEQPIADNSTKEGLRMNRRVELRNAQ